MKTLRVLMIGDIVGEPGIKMVQRHIDALRHTYKADFVVVNGENSAPDGRGITPAIMSALKACGVNVVTTGNHVWQKKEIYSYFQSHDDLVRPLNFPTSCPGNGFTIAAVHGVPIAVVNVQGRIFMREFVEDPFRCMESVLTYIKTKTPIILVDMHAEATTEKIGLAWTFDGRVSAVVGTHTHVQTADERILPGGTAFITDLGMGGALNSMIGMKKESVLPAMITQMPSKFMVETQGPKFLCGVFIEIDVQTGRALSIERVRVDDVD